MLLEVGRGTYHCDGNCGILGDEEMVVVVDGVASWVIALLDAGNGLDVLLAWRLMSSCRQRERRGYASEEEA
jgi:hypothetical protein